MEMKELLKKIKEKNVKNVILDTDTYNEVDDQYAIAYLLRAEDRVRLLAITAAPFFNNRSSSPEDGMLKSYDEILHTLDMADMKGCVPVYRGATGYMTEKNVPQISDAARNIVRIVNESDDTVYIVAIGCITNVASAISLDPSIADKAVVIWLGGHAYWHTDTNEFNMRQDIAAANTVFDSKIALIQIPCMGMCSELVTTLPELEYYLRGKSKLCDWLTDMVVDYAPAQPYAWSKVMWDVSAAAVLVRPEAFVYDILPTPSVTQDMQYSFDSSRHEYVYVRKLNRNTIFGDMFGRLSRRADNANMTDGGKKIYYTKENLTPDINSALVPPAIIRDIAEDDRDYSRHFRRWQSAPCIARTRGGRLFCTYSGDNSTEAWECPNNYNLISVSNDNGKSWSCEKFVIDHMLSVRMHEPILWLDPKGRLWHFWSQSYDWWDGRGGVWAMYCDNPDADAIEWSTPKRLCDGVMATPPIALTEDKWLYPVSIWKYYKNRLFHLPEQEHSNVYMTVDGGNSVTRIGYADEPTTTFDENTLALRKDGSLLMTMRGKSMIARSE